MAFKSKDQLDGLPVAEMSKDQQKLVEQVIADPLLPFRKKDVAEAMQLIASSGGVGSLSMAFYRNLDLSIDKVWDVWQLESPKMVWYLGSLPRSHVGTSQGLTAGDAGSALETVIAPIRS